ncbi:hypothetical protein HF288_10560 [Acidithiobacillus caldus]|uniref:COG4280 domain-containing protein n=1 Tax=Acidithiobacillus caldus TaxID=33059 RepID=UPI001C07BCDC|nr:hypothetical protein [Acidithiobacillus caldus]MBU2789940.1 hypothetical protein [Acidithiobacillus caldus]MBU2821756.1 hypothetical protein [Acidithiobacillus caldus]
MSPWQIVTATGLAAIVEWVEAFTIVLAVALTIGWPRALGASIAAILTLVAMTVAGGSLLLAGIDVLWLQAVVGIFLLFFGSRWLAKAIARASGRVPLHDEEKAFAKTQNRLRGDVSAAWLVAYKGVLLEGLEVWLIVIALGAQTHTMTLAAAAAAGALVLVALAGGIIHRPLRRVPENSMKFFVGAMITAFGSYWSLHALGLAWPGEDAAIPVLVAFYLLTGMLAVLLLRANKVRGVAA